MELRDWSLYIHQQGNAVGKAAKRNQAYQTGDAFWQTAIQTMDRQRTETVQGTKDVQAISLEERLKAKYPGLVYHVFDGSSGYWRTRNDYPHYLLYQENIDTQALENWQPKGANPPYAESASIRALGQVPPRSKAVVIHPKVQERMERDSEYADEIMARIEAWFTFDAVRNEAILPGITMEMSQSIVIGEDGNIANVCSSSSGRITYSKSGSDDDLPTFWELRMMRHEYYMQRWQAKQMEHSMSVTQQFMNFRSIQAAKARLHELMGNEDFRKALGDTICGFSLEEVFAATWQSVEKGIF